MNVLYAALWGALASSSLLLGALLTFWKPLPSRYVGWVMGFGSGALMSSIAYELLPESKVAIPSFEVILSFVAGAMVFMGADNWVSQLGGEGRKQLNPVVATVPAASGAAIFLGTLLDGIPESAVLGMDLATGGKISLAFLAAVFISNIPEGIAGTQSLLASGKNKKQIMVMWLGLVIASAIFSGIGNELATLWPATIDGSYTKAFAAGAVMIMLANVMMPEAYEHGGKFTGAFTIFGFLVATLLTMVE